MWIITEKAAIYSQLIPLTLLLKEKLIGSKLNFPEPFKTEGKKKRKKQSTVSLGGFMVS